MIEGLFEVNGLVMVAGPPGSYKSFLAISWMLSMASGREWCGRKTQPAKVLYALGEGKASLFKRIQAWCIYNGLEDHEINRIDENFRTTFEVPQMGVKLSVSTMLGELDEARFRPEVIVVDTLARSFVGMDENTQQDTGLWVEQADRLRQLGYTVIVLHHTAKNTEFGVKYRGSTAIMGAMDTAMTLVRESPASDNVILTVTKQKDNDEGRPVYFRKTAVPIPDSKKSSIVLVPYQKQDERARDDGEELDRLITDLLIVPYESDRARAREVAKAFNITESAAAMRISRVRKGHEGDKTTDD